MEIEQERLLRMLRECAGDGAEKDGLSLGDEDVRAEGPSVAEDLFGGGRSRAPIQKRAFRSVVAERIPLLDRPSQ